MWQINNYSLNTLRRFVLAIQKKNLKMDSHYHRYSSNVSNYLKNCPREFVKHCLIKLSMAKAIRNNSIKIINHGVFSVKSKNSNDAYTV